MESKTHGDGKHAPRTAPIQFSVGLAIGIAALVAYLFKPSFIPIPNTLRNLIAAGGLVVGVLFVVTGAGTLLLHKRNYSSGSPPVTKQVFGDISDVDWASSDAD